MTKIEQLRAQKQQSKAKPRKSENIPVLAEQSDGDDYVDDYEVLY